MEANVKKNIFIYLQNKEQLPLVYAIVKDNPIFEYGIFVEGIQLEYFLRTPVGKLQNIQFVDRNNWNIALLSNYRIFLSTDTRMEKNSPVLMILLRMFTALDVPILDLQCTIIQTSIKQSSFATHFLRWFDDNSENSSVIGYPLFLNNSIVSEGEYILVLSDLCCSCYTGRDIANFVYAIYEYAKAHTGAAIIWKMQDEEKSNSNVMRVINNCKAFYANELDKVILCHENPMLSRLATTELIAKAKLVIMTITIPNLLDCEMYNKPVALYNTLNDISNIISKENITIFHNANELETVIFDNACKKLHTNMLFPYDNDAFISVVDDFYTQGPINKKDYIATLATVSLLFEKCSTYKQTNSDVYHNGSLNEIEKLKKKYKKHIKAIRKLVIAVASELVFIIILLLLLYLN